MEHSTNCTNPRPPPTPHRVEPFNGRVDASNFVAAFSECLGRRSDMDRLVTQLVRRDQKGSHWLRTRLLVSDGRIFDVRLLLVTPSTSYRTGAFLKAAHDLGLEVTVATDAPPAIPGASVYVPLDDPGTAAERLIAVVGSVDGVVGSDGAAVAVAAEVARRLGILPTNSAESLLIAGNKYLQRRACETSGVPQPEFALLTRQRPETWSTFPAVLKPLDRTASQGVVRIESADGLRDGMELVGKIVGGDADLLVEQFVPGGEVAVECFLRGGHVKVVAVFDKPDTPRGPTFPETILVSPARLQPKSLRRLVEVVHRAISSIGLTEGPVHVECKVEGTDIWFLELAARSIGGLCSRALTTGGVTYEELILRQGLSLPAPPQLPDRGASGVLMLPVEKSGQLQAVHGVDEARAIEGVSDVVITIGDGEVVATLPVGDRYLGFIFARAATADDVETALRKARSEIDVSITAL
jgi:biotin carboxylase